MMRGVVLTVALLAVYIPQPAYQLEVSLCYRREANLRCGMQIPIKEGAKFQIKRGSVTAIFSSNVEDLQTKNLDGKSCSEIPTECSASMRESNLESFAQPLVDIYRLVENACDGKTECSFTVPDWDSVSLSPAEAKCQGDPDKTYHLKAIYVDLKCEFPIQTTTTTTTTTMTAPTTIDLYNYAEVGLGDETVQGESTSEEPATSPESATVGETIEGPTTEATVKDGEMSESDDSTEDVGDTPKKTDDGTKDVQAPPPVGPKRQSPGGGSAAPGHMTCSAVLATLSVMANLLL